MGPGKILSDVNTEELEGVQPLHLCHTCVQRCALLPPLLRVTSYLLGFVSIYGEIVVLAPCHQAASALL